MRTFLATLVGLIAAFMVMMAVELIGHKLYPLPFEMNAENAGEIEKSIPLIPLSAYVSVIVAHGLGLLVGLLVSMIIDQETPYPVYLIGTFLFIGTIVNLFSFPHPTWFAITDVVVMLAIGVPLLFKAQKRTQN